MAPPSAPSAAGSWRPTWRPFRNSRCRPILTTRSSAAPDGGTVNTTLKSGGKDWHGDVFDYWRNRILDANTFQNNAGGKERGFHNQHQFGGVAGGPIRKDKDFIFFSQESWREVVPFPLVTSVPPLDIRDGQHFSNYGVKVFDPLTTRPCTAADNCPSGVQNVRSAFPDNKIPASRISPVGKNILALFPAPMATPERCRITSCAPILSAATAITSPWAGGITCSTRTIASTPLSPFQHGHEFRNNNGFDAPAQRGNITSQRTDQNYIADYTRVLSPTTVLDIRGSFSRFTSIFPDGDEDFNFTYDKLGIKSMPIPPTVDRKTAPVIRLDLYPDIIGTSYSWSTDNQMTSPPASP
jgi:hypothetical protein